ncbi:MAG: type II toxin-antitoxin system Phd/YefM family antitoxin [Methylococcales bacterium]
MNINVTELGLHLGRYLAKANQEPVVVEQNGHSMAVLVSPELFQSLMMLKEDAAWAEKALDAENSGYAGMEGVRQLLDMAGEKDIEL